MFPAVTMGMGSNAGGNTAVNMEGRRTVMSSDSVDGLLFLSGL